MNPQLTALLTHYALLHIEDFMQFVDRQTDSEDEAMGILQQVIVLHHE